MTDLHCMLHPNCTTSTTIKENTMVSMPKLTDKSSTTVILSIDENGVASAILAPGSSLTVDVGVPSHDDFADFTRSLYSPRRYDGATETTIKISPSSKGFTRMISVDPDGSPSDTGLNDAIEASIKGITDYRAQMEREARQTRRRVAAENLLEAEGIGPKKAARIAAALIETTDEVQ